MALGNNETGGKLPFGPKPGKDPAIAFGRNALTQALVFAQDYSPGVVLGPNHFDMVSHTAGAFANTAQQNGPFGSEITFLGNTSSDKYTGLPSNVQDLHQISFEFIFKGNVDTFMALVCKSSTASPGTASFFGVFWNDTSHCLSISAGFSTSDGSWVSAAVFVPNQFTHVVITYDDTSLSNVPKVYRNGISVAMTPTNPVGTRLTDDGDLQIGNFQTQAFGASADMSYMRIYNRILLPQEAVSLASNPWQVYRQAPQQQAYALPASNPTFSIAGAGTAALDSTAAIAVSGIATQSLKAASSMSPAGAGTAVFNSVSRMSISGASALAMLAASRVSIAGVGAFSPLAFAPTFSIAGAAVFKPLVASIFGIEGAGIFSPQPFAGSASLFISGVGTCNFIMVPPFWQPQGPTATSWNPDADTPTDWTPQGPTSPPWTVQ